MKAERERRAQVTEAKGNKESQILQAQAEAEEAETEAKGRANAENRRSQRESTSNS